MCEVQGSSIHGEEEINAFLLQPAAVVIIINRRWELRQ
jgi:hypothetical protein